VIEASLVANGSRIAGTVRGSILSPGVIVEAGAEVLGSVVLSDTRIGSGARIEGAILDKYVQIGSEARVGGILIGEDGSEWLGGLTLVGKDATVPDGARVSRGAVVGVGARPEDFGDEVPAGTLMPGRSWIMDVAASAPRRGTS
jgi:glucose-1-phosphate adenylyltransferase